MTPKNADLILIRMDRIGDLILTLPVDQQPGLKNQTSHWFMEESLEFIMNNCSPQRSYSTLKRNFSWNQFWAFVKAIKKLRSNTAIVFHGPWWIGFGLWLAKIPNRVGRYSQWHSFLFFNKGVRQKRSRAEKHEYQYNLDLVKKAFPQIELQPDHLRLTSKNSDKVLAAHRLSPNTYYVIHPGMSGSALNWSSQNYIQLIDRLISKGSQVAITGTKSDWPYIKPIKEKLGSQDSIVWLNEKLSGEDLISLLERAKCVVVPSTGVAHISASAGAPTLGIYSNVLVETWHRWGPLGDRVAIAHPSSPIKERQEPEVMDEISVDQVLKLLNQLEGTPHEN